MPREPLDLDAIEARATAATKWSPENCDLRRDPEDGCAYAVQGATLGDTLIQLADTYEGSSEDWRFIAHARTDIPALVAAVRERDATIADLRARLAVFVERERLDARMIDDPDDCTPDYLDPETR